VARQPPSTIPGIRFDGADRLTSGAAPSHTKPMGYFCRVKQKACVTNILQREAQPVTMPTAAHQARPRFRNPRAETFFGMFANKRFVLTRTMHNHERASSTVLDVLAHEAPLYLHAVRPTAVGADRLMIPAISSDITDFSPPKRVQSPYTITKKQKYRSSLDSSTPTSILSPLQTKSRIGFVHQVFLLWRIAFILKADTARKRI